MALGTRFKPRKLAPRRELTAVWPGRGGPVKSATLSPSNISQMAGFLPVASARAEQWSDRVARAGFLIPLSRPAQQSSTPLVMQTCGAQREASPVTSPANGRVHKASREIETQVPAFETTRCLKSPSVGHKKKNERPTVWLHQARDVVRKQNAFPLMKRSPKHHFGYAVLQWVRISNVGVEPITFRFEVLICGV